MSHRRGLPEVRGHVWLIVVSATQNTGPSAEEVLWIKKMRKVAGWDAQTQLTVSLRHGSP